MIKPSNKNLIKLVTAMQDGDYHDGTALGDSLGITRSAVWKMIKRLESYGVEMSSVKGRGYALCEPLLLLDHDIISNQLVHDVALEVFESVPSTNDYLKNVEHTATARYCLSEHQSNGRGRLNREWVSPFAKNIYLSALFPLQKDISELAGLSLVVSLAINQALRECAIDEGVTVKWPNDILHNGQKLAGVLVEIQAESHGMCHAVIGIGLNVNMLLDTKRGIDQKWTSMRKITGQYLDRNPVCAALINALHAYLQTFTKHGFAHFSDAWLKEQGMLGKQVKLQNANQIIEGEMVGINDKGHLLLKLANGQQQAFSSGDTTFLK